MFETRNWKFETRKRRCCNPVEPSFEFRFSTSTIDNRQSAIDTERVCQLTNVE